MSARKPADKRVRGKRTRDAGDTGGVVVAISAGLQPEPSPEWSAPIADEWAEYWGSELARISTDTDVPVIRRLFGYRDLVAKLLREGMAEPMVLGSTGQIRANPALAEAAKWESQLQSLESALGLTPKARLALGIDLANATTSLAKMNANITGDTDEPAEDDADVLAMIDAK